MRFKQEDIGLYIAMMLLGAGTGLLIGSFIASRIAAKKEEADIDEELEANELADEIWAAREAEVMGTFIGHTEDGIAIFEDPPELTEEEQAMKEEAEEIAEEEDYVASEQVKKFEARQAAAEELKAEAESREKTPRIEREPDMPVNTSKYTDEELVDFISEHEPQLFMINMLYNGTMTMEQVLGVIEREEEALAMDDEDYSKQYRNVFEDPPEVEENPVRVPPPNKDLVEVYEVVNDRWAIMNQPSLESTDKVLSEIAYDPDEDAFFYMHKDRMLDFQPGRFGGQEVWEIAEQIMRSSGRDEIIIEDLAKPRWYIISYVKSAAAEAAEDRSDESS